MQKAIIVGSKHHFSPGVSAPNYGIGKLLSDLLEALRNAGFEDIEYFDYLDNFHSNPEAIMFSIDLGFSRAKKQIAPALSVLVSVNQVRSLRPRWLSKNLAQTFSDCKYISAEDNLFLLDFPEFRADYILQLGSHNIDEMRDSKSSLLSKVIPIQIARIKRETSAFSSEDISNKKVLFFLGSICLRKGWNFIRLVIPRLISHFPNIKVHIHGRATNIRIRSELHQLTQNFPGQVLWTSDFHDEGSDEYQKIFQGAVLAIFPSLEEGQQDAVIETVQSGVPVTCSFQCGYALSLENCYHDFAAFELVWQSLFNLLDADVSILKSLHERQLKQLTGLVSTQQSLLGAILEMKANPISKSPKSSYLTATLRGILRFPFTNLILALARFRSSLCQTRLL